MRWIILILLSFTIKGIAYCQDTDSTQIKEEVKALAVGLRCCEQVELLNAKIEVQNDIISNLDEQIVNEQAKYSLKHGDWVKSDSLLRASVTQLNSCNSETKRLKRGKRNWQIFGISVGVGVLTWFIVK